MRNHNTIVVKLAMLAALAAADSALAYYGPKLGRFISRDPIDEPRTIQTAAAVVRPFIARDPVGGVMTEAYRYSLNSPTMAIDAVGLEACKLSDPTGCCTCLAYSEAGGSPGCLDAVVRVMRNRQKLDWNDFKGEKTFCEQAAKTRAWAGGEGAPRYENCCKCLSNADKYAENPGSCPDCGPGGDSKKCCPLSNAEAEAAEKAANACRAAAAGGHDPTGGAQFYWTKGKTPKWMLDQERRGNCSRVTVPGCPLEFWKCKNRPAQ